MKKWLLLVPAIASLAVGTFILAKKDKEDASEVSEGKKEEKKDFLNPWQGSYSFVSGFKDAKTVSLKKSKKSYKAKSLKKGKTYYVRLRSVKTSGNKQYVSDWSGTKKIKVK